MIYKLQKAGLIPKIIRSVHKPMIPESSINKILTYNSDLIRHPKTMEALHNIGLDKWATSGYYDILGEEIKLDPVFAAGLHLPRVKSIIGENPIFFGRAESPLGKPQLRTYHGALFGSSLRNASTYVKPLNLDIVKKVEDTFKEIRHNLNADNVFDYYPNFAEMIKNKSITPNENALGFYVTNGDNIKVLDAEKAGGSHLKGHFPEIELEYKDLFGDKIPEQTIRKGDNPETRFTTDNIAKLATKTGTTYVIKNVGDPGYYSLIDDPGRYTTEIIVPLGQPVKSVLGSSFNGNPKEFGNTFKIFKRGGIIKAQGGGGKVVRKLPNLLFEEIGAGKKAASEFFKHPVVKQSYEHNKDIAKRLGITLQDRPENIAEIVDSPIGVNFVPYNNNGEIGAIHHSGIDDPNQLLSIAGTPMTESQAERIGFHEMLHRGFYSAPIKYVNTNFDYYNNVYQPTYKYGHGKTSKLLKPGTMNSYLGDVHSGEAGTNLAEVGKTIGVKIGEKWPGDEKFLETLDKWPEDKKFMLDYLNTDTRAGRRHIGDAMAAKYFTIGTAAAFSNGLNNSNDKETKKPAL